MTIGILTFHFAHNYGAVLQAYSLCEHIKSLGHDAQIIDYRPQKMADEYSLSPLKAQSFKSAAKGILTYPYARWQHSQFNQFISEDLSLSRRVTSVDELAELCRAFDTILVGSDQVWNPDLTGNDGAYFLDFPLGNGVTAYSYAASFGKDTLTGIPGTFLSSLKKFKAISLREETCAEELFGRAGIRARKVADPVFLHDSQYWASRGHGCGIPEGGYCLFYGLQENKVLMDYAREHTAGLPLYSIHPTAVKQPVGVNLNNIGPREFISLVQGAERVFTNSFHGLAFSSIFGRDTYTALHSTLGSRSASLLALFGIELSDKNSLIHADFGDVDRSQFNCLVSESKEFLDECTGGDR